MRISAKEWSEGTEEAGEKMKRYYDKRDKDCRLIEKRRAEKGERRCVKVCIPVCVCVCGRVLACT